MGEYLILFFVLGCVGSTALGYWIGCLREAQRTDFWRTSYAQLVGTLSRVQKGDSHGESGTKNAAP